MVTAAIPVGSKVGQPMTREERKVIFASSLGTVFEWYDFYLYGTLAGIIGAQFFTPLDVASRNIFALLASRRASWSGRSVRSSLAASAT